MPKRTPLGGSPAGSYTGNDIEADARLRISSGCGLFGASKKLPAVMNTAYARMVLLRVCKMFHEISGLDSRLVLGTFTQEEQELLASVMNVDAALQPVRQAELASLQSKAAIDAIKKKEF